MGWHVIYVKSRFEKKVHQSLLDMSIDSYLPLVKTMRKWSDRKKIIYKPLFPSYVFAYIKSSLDFHRALSIDGASAYIRFGNEYAKVPDHEIDKIKLLSGDEDVASLEIETQTFREGDRMTINYGSLSGLECVVLKGDNSNKIIVGIDSLKQNIVVTLSSNYLSLTQRLSS